MVNAEAVILISMPLGTLVTKESRWFKFSRIQDGATAQKIQMQPMRIITGFLVS